MDRNKPTSEKITLGDVFRMKGLKGKDAEKALRDAVVARVEKPENKDPVLARVEESERADG